MYSLFTNIVEIYTKDSIQRTTWIIVPAIILSVWQILPHLQAIEKFALEPQGILILRMAQSILSLTVLSLGLLSSLYRAKYIYTNKISEILEQHKNEIKLLKNEEQLAIQNQELADKLNSEHEETY